jgi:hypothetical protein
VDEDDGLLLVTELIELLMTLAGIDERFDGRSEPPPDPPQETSARSTPTAIKGRRKRMFFMLIILMDLLDIKIVASEMELK